MTLFTSLRHRPFALPFLIKDNLHLDAVFVVVGALTAALAALGLAHPAIRNLD